MKEGIHTFMYGECGLAYCTKQYINLKTCFSVQEIKKVNNKREY